MTKKEFLAFRVSPELKRQIEQIADSEERSISQICELFLRGAVETYRSKQGHYVQDLLRKDKSRKSDVRAIDRKESRS